MALHHKWGVKTGFTFALPILISDCLGGVHTRLIEDIIGIHFEKSTNLAITVSTRIESTTATTGSSTAHTATSAASNLASTASPSNHTVC